MKANNASWIGMQNRTFTFRQIWIASIALVVLATMGIGAVTRLTGSGLSIVEWKPLAGTIPPLNEAQWTKEFLRYQQFPEFRSNPKVTLENFKTIFWWEFSHRLIARSLIFVILLPFAILYFRRLHTPRDLKRLSVLLVMGAVQGALGWYMVKSGLVQVPRVSHFRLMAHFVWASLIIAYLAHWLREQGTTGAKTFYVKDQILFQFLSIVCLLQMVLGALVAGSRAGYIYNSFPKFGDSWLPQNFFIYPTITENLFYNQINLQFFHRLGGWLMLAACIYTLLRRHFFISFLIMIQFALGVLTLLMMVPPAIATLHQLCGVFLFFTLRYSVHPSYMSLRKT